MESTGREALETTTEESESVIDNGLVYYDSDYFDNNQTGTEVDSLYRMPVEQDESFSYEIEIRKQKE